MLPGYSTFHQEYIRYILHIMEIPTYHWINIVDGTQRYTRLTAFRYCMIVPLCLPLLLHFDIVTWVLRIRNVYI